MLKLLGQRCFVDGFAGRDCRLVTAVRFGETGDRCMIRVLVPTGRTVEISALDLFTAPVSVVTVNGSSIWFALPAGRARELNALGLYGALGAASFPVVIEYRIRQ
jgi:hypothetical protein